MCLSMSRRLTCPPAKGCRCDPDKYLDWVHAASMVGTSHCTRNVKRYSLRGVGQVPTWPYCKSCTARIQGWPRVRAPPKPNS